MNDIINFKFYLTQDQLGQITTESSNIFETFLTQKENHPDIPINIEVILTDKENDLNSSMLLEALRRYVNSY